MQSTYDRELALEILTQIFDSHHYFDVDAEAIFDVCENHSDLLGGAIKKIMDDL